MSSRTLAACLLGLMLLLAACARTPGDAPPDPAAHRPAAAHDGAGLEPALDEPPEEVPPATAPDAARALAPLAADFSGYGPVPFGSDEQALRQAWTGPLAGGAEAQDDVDACHYLFPQPRPAQGHGTAFMVEGGRFVRMDVDDPDVVAPGGGRVGMAAAAIAALYPGRVEEHPHKYVEGAKYLRVTREGSDAALLFETDAQGRVRAWRLGLPPQVDYVEGCS